MHIHIIGICGTFMGGVAALARELGHTVSGSDARVYPPMSTQLETLGIKLREGYAAGNLEPEPDLVVIGNVLSRGNPEVEACLDRALPYTSGPAWLAATVLDRRPVIAVAGTHGKTTTSALLAWLLEAAGLAPGFLIGGVPGNFGVSARLGSGEWFVIEADEYDTAFFDKRSKFVHYRPRIAVLANLEYDHADIFDSIEDIERQFHHLVRTVPGRGRLIVGGDAPHIDRVLAMGCWTPVECFGDSAGSTGWRAEPVSPDASQFRVYAPGDTDTAAGEVRWSVIGRHNMCNALAAIAAAHHAGVPIETACEAASTFRPARRRLERIGVFEGVTVIEDFAHHPTAIRETIAAVRTQCTRGRLFAVLDPRSNSMKRGVYRDTLAVALDGADRVLLLANDSLAWNPRTVIDALGGRATLCEGPEAAVELLASELRKDDWVVAMSNGDFGNLPRRLGARLDGDRDALVATAREPGLPRPV